MELIKTCDQYPHKFNFGHFFSSIILPLSTGENGFSKTVVSGKSWKVSVIIVVYTGLRKKFKKYSGEIKSLGVHRNMRGCILEFNSEGLGWW